MKPQLAVAVVVILSILLGIAIYINPVVAPPGPATTTEVVHDSYGNFLASLNIPLTHAVSNGMQTYSGTIPVPEACILNAGATVYADTETRVVIGLNLMQAFAPAVPCDTWANPTLQDFSVTAGGQGPLVLTAVAVNSVVVKHTLND